jgi:pimeloyl-ACP methyl ester carboxylesterase
MFMNKRVTRWIRLICISALPAFCLLNILAFRHASAMLNFDDLGERTSQPEALSFRDKATVLLMGTRIPRPVSAALPEQLAADAREIQISSPDGATLSAWYVSRGDESPLIILFHGYSAEKSSLIDEAREFLATGASVMLVDFRGSGGSSESYTTIGIHEAIDVKGAVDYAQTHLPHRALILYGQSMGAAAILRAGAHHGVEVDGIILESVFDTMLNTVSNRFHTMGVPAFPAAQLLVMWGGVQFGFNGLTHRPMEDIVSLSSPVLFLHGADDPRARLADARRVASQATAPSTFEVFPGVGHASCLEAAPNQWRQAVNPFCHEASHVR